MRASITATDAGEIGFFLAAVGARVQKGAPQITHKNANDLQDAVRSYAEGRPGPNKITGAYWESIKVRRRGFGDEVYSQAPQAWRLEVGFVGVDSLGRHYNDPPRPHWAPAIEEVEPKYNLELNALVEEAIRVGPSG